MNVDAIIWDYDGTLVNSVPKNLDVTKQILSVVAPRLTGDNLPDCLKSEIVYSTANHQAKNWQDLYISYFGMTKIEMLDAGRLWTEYQLKNPTPVNLFPKIKEAIDQISIPQGICSQNSSENINCVLNENNLSHKFGSIVGYDDIPPDEQKPSGYGGIKCLKQLFDTIAEKIILYIGDHEMDVEFARNLKDRLCEKSKVISVVVKYSGADTKLWTHKPDFEISAPTDLFKIISNFR
ncbi:HAD family hydrolase [bacterium]|nr:HAD family hydrolase [bacterium]